jgi:hypothetical protein
MNLQNYYAEESACFPAKFDLFVNRELNPRSFVRIPDRRYARFAAFACCGSAGG